jgi:DNA/RNA-binding domain of Phe-tRNA-synthetase-like protein
MDSFEGDLRLTTAAGDEQFVPLGSSENEPPYPGEIIYKDDKGAVCRCWNWREAQRTMLTEKTKNAFLCIELVDEKRANEFNSALEELANLVSKHLGGTVETHVLDAGKREVNIC